MIILRSLAFTHRWGIRQIIGTDVVKHRYSQRNLYSMSNEFSKGDPVQIEINGYVKEGSIIDRNGGWYSVKLVDETQSIIKRRKSQISATTMKISTPHESSTIVDESVSSVDLDYMDHTLISTTIIDLDAALFADKSGDDTTQTGKTRSYLDQCKHFSTISKWVTFSDLHVAPSTLNTCIDVLTAVHKTAKQENAGVLFLGDFWHHRGTVRVDCLNAVLNVLGEWEVPMIMIPGNHDQVSLDGLEHALTPLQNAYRISTEYNQSINGILIFSSPTKFMNALFVPHIRDIVTMQGILQSKSSSSSSAVFVHADVTGAQMNDLIISTGGVAPVYFPPFIPIYSGHFHKPHTVEKPDAAPNVSIRYVGSPYETNLQEANQEKAFLILNCKNNWKCEREIPLSIGRKHWRARSIDEFIKLPVNNINLGNDSITGPFAQINSGDRVVVSVNQLELESLRRIEGSRSTFDEKIRNLRSIGVFVDVREIKPTPLLSQTQDKSFLKHMSTEDLSPFTRWTNYLNEEVMRKTVLNETAAMLIESGLKVLEELGAEDGNNISDVVDCQTSLFLKEISLEGFGSFKDRTTYPLDHRGLVLLRGSNLDGGSDSNGSGKTTLAMSTLWGLTGSLDPRPLEDGKVSDVIHDDASTARVIIRGTLNGSTFLISRSKSKSKSSLTFVLNNEDLTRQSVKETQQLIDEKLGMNSQLLSRTIFHGQHSINGLLEATDTKLKEELSLIEPLKLWQDASSHSRKLAREASKKVSELDGMISIRARDVVQLENKLDAAASSLSLRRSELEAKEADIQSKLTQISMNIQPINDHLPELETRMKVTSERIKELEKILQDPEMDISAELAPLQRSIDIQSKLLLDEETMLLKHQRQVYVSEMALETAEGRLKNLDAVWDTDNITSDSWKAPDICPTCNQATHIESHQYMRNQVEQELEKARVDIVSLNKILNLDKSKLYEQQQKTISIQLGIQDMRNRAEEIEMSWKVARKRFDSELQAARRDYEDASIATINALSGSSTQTELLMIRNEADHQLQSHKKDVHIAAENHNSLSKELSNLKASISELEIKRDNTKVEADFFMDMAEKFGARGIQTYILTNAVFALQVATQMYLDELSDGLLRLEMNLDSGDRIIRTISIQSSDGTWVQRPLSSLSGGQWRRCSLAISLGFSDLISRRGKFRSSLLVLDEPLTHLDSSGRDNVGKLLRKIVKEHKSEELDGSLFTGLHVSTVLVILQDLAAEELAESFDCIDEVTKKAGFSKVSVDVVF